MKESKLLKELQACPGVELRKSRRNSHLKVYVGGRMVTVLPWSSSDWRAEKNARAVLRRAGVPV